MLPARELLESKYRETESRFRDRVVDRPPFWGGYRLIPSRVEFWYGRPDRLHDRILYTRKDSGWEIQRLYP
jgi:pyridoxamine 5'-phosphate oxidase